MAVSDYMTRKEAAHYLTQAGCPVSAVMLAKMAHRNNSGNGPPFLRYRTHTVRYKREDLDVWASKQMKRVG